MGVMTAISWTDHTFNPWWGCQRVSPGCEHCYAEAFSKRTGHDVWGKGSGRRLFGDKHWNEPLRWNAKAEKEGVRRRVFCASMADVFEDRADLVDERARLFALIEATPSLDWQLLTKRPENVADMQPAEWAESSWPSNVWLGTTVEDQKCANERVPLLLGLRVAVLFVSCEPLLDTVLLGPWLYEGIDWVIVGGESGPKHRPLDLENARVLRDECEEAGVAFFFKQVGGYTPTAGGDLLDGVAHKEFPA